MCTFAPYILKDYEYFEPIFAAYILSYNFSLIKMEYSDKFVSKKVPN